MSRTATFCPDADFLSITDLMLSVSGQVEDTPDSMVFYTYLPNEPLSKERVEAFSDGVYAIVATLLILDIWYAIICLCRTTLMMFCSV